MRSHTEHLGRRQFLLHRARRRTNRPNCRSASGNRDPISTGRPSVCDSALVTAFKSSPIACKVARCASSSLRIASDEPLGTSISKRSTGGSDTNSSRFFNVLLGAVSKAALYSAARVRAAAINSIFHSDAGYASRLAAKIYSATERRDDPIRLSLHSHRDGPVP